MLQRRAFLAVAVAALAAAVCAGQQSVSPTPAPGPPRGQGPPAAQVSPPTFRAMTYNIHHGEGADGRLDIERIAALIRDERADLVALQEVDRGVERTNRRDLPAELAALTGMTCLFRNNHAFQGGEYGNAILTRFPVKRWANTLLRMLRAGEQRGVLQAVVDVGGRELLFMNTHIDYRPDDAERLENVAQVREVLAEYGNMPVLFGGDFNDTPGSRTYAAMAAMFDDLWLRAGAGVGFTIPSREPNKRIDFLWLGHGGPLRAVRAWVPRSEGSDHLPVVAEFAWE
jgi:endonuclease/exonuclease/phosphatase family metal-dependent hydrolase